MTAAPKTTATILGDSQQTRALRRYLPKVANSEVTVLITGETGTGKEKVAEALHAMNARRRGRLVPVNCAALPEALIESELFGHRRGAFTGASSNYAGKVAEADGGTLFLDEIGEMSLHAQVKLLRLLEARAVDRVGAACPVPVNVRVVAATNQALSEQVRAGTFRADLYYRLNVARIEIAPLRDRPGDIAALINAFIAEFNRFYHGTVGEPSADLLACLKRYDWPGNVRELRNLVEAVFIDPPTGPLCIDHLPPSYRHLIGVSTEREHLLAALQQSNWNKTAAAKKLKWSRMTLYRKLEKHRVSGLSVR